MSERAAAVPHLRPSGPGCAAPQGALQPPGIWMTALRLFRHLTKLKAPAAEASTPQSSKGTNPIECTGSSSKG